MNRLECCLHCTTHIMISLLSTATAVVVVVIVVVVFAPFAFYLLVMHIRLNTAAMLTA